MQYARSADGVNAIINYHHIWLSDLKYVDMFYELGVGGKLTREEVRQRFNVHCSDRTILKTLNELIQKQVLQVETQEREGKAVSLYQMNPLLIASITEWNQFLAPGKRTDA